MGLMSRQKGKRGERLLAAELRAALPEHAAGIRRGWQSREGDDDPDIVGVPGVWFENKVGVQPNPRAALAQATEASRGRGVPIAVVRDDRRPPFVVLHLVDFLPMLRAWLHEERP